MIFQEGEQILTVGYAVSGDPFLADKPRVWASNASGATGFDIAAGGQRLAVNVPTSTREAQRQARTIVFTQNFFDELRRRVAVRP